MQVAWQALILNLTNQIVDYRNAAELLRGSAKKNDVIRYRSYILHCTNLTFAGCGTLVT